jgi:hypothetical protein
MSNTNIIDDSLYNMPEIPSRKINDTNKSKMDDSLYNLPEALSRKITDSKNSKMDDSLYHLADQKETSFFSHIRHKSKNEIDSSVKLPELETPEEQKGKPEITKNIKISPIEEMLNIGRRNTPTILPNAPEISRAPTPTINRPGFRGRIRRGETASRAETPAPVLDGQWQSRRAALDILEGVNEENNQPVDDQLPVVAPVMAQSIVLTTSMGNTQVLDQEEIQLRE